MSKKESVQISKDLIDMIKRQVDISDGAFKNVEDYIEFVLLEVLKEEITAPAYTPEEEEKIKKRLEKLGYI